MNRNNLFFFFLFRIVKNRASLKNFQLIVITHDEDFVDSLGKSAYADKCYRVSKTNTYVIRIYQLYIFFCFFNSGLSKIDVCNIASFGAH